MIWVVSSTICINYFFQNISWNEVKTQLIFVTKSFVWVGSWCWSPPNLTFCVVNFDFDFPRFQEIFSHNKLKSKWSLSPSASFETKKLTIHSILKLKFNLKVSEVKHKIRSCCSWIWNFVFFALNIFKIFRKSTKPIFMLRVPNESLDSRLSFGTRLFFKKCFKS